MSTVTLCRRSACVVVYFCQCTIIALSCVIGCRIKVLYRSFNPVLASFFNTLHPTNTMRNIILDDIDNVSHGIHDLPSITIMWTNTVEDKPYESSGFGSQILLYLLLIVMKVFNNEMMGTLMT